MQVNSVTHLKAHRSDVGRLGDLQNGRSGQARVMNGRTSQNLRLRKIYAMPLTMKVNTLERT